MQRGPEFEIGNPWTSRARDPFSLGDSVFSSWSDRTIIQALRTLARDEAEEGIKPRSGDPKRPLLSSLGDWLGTHIPHFPHA